MNSLKQFFISAYVTYCVVVTGFGVMSLSNGGDFSIWLAVSVATALPVIYFAWLYLSSVPRTSPGLVGVTGGIFMVTMYSVYTSYNSGVASPLPLLALFSLVGWATYVGWYSHLGDRNEAKLKVGKKLPKMELENYAGDKVSSEDWKEESSLILFYRGNWCPICTAQVQELIEYEDRFEGLGVKMRFVSPQSHKKSESFAKRTGMKADFLVDPKNSVAEKLGILHKGGLPFGFQVLGYDSDVPKPTIIITDSAGKIKFLDLTENYRLRPTPGDLLTAIQS
ncbi:MAG: peroxiredoxin [Bacteroidia bacterium]|jgi:peroxiredoxin